MSRTVKASYGRRSRPAVSHGVKPVATTFGQVKVASYSDKVDGGHYLGNSVPEHLVGLMLSIDPGISRYVPQPFTVDLVEHRVLRTTLEFKMAKEKYLGMSGPLFYTPDYGLEYVDAGKGSLEVKKFGFEGDAEYDEKLICAERIIRAHGHGFKKMVLPCEDHPMYFSVPLLVQAMGRMDLIEEKDMLERVAMLAQRGAVTLKDFGQGLGIGQNLMPVLLAKGVLSADIWNVRLDFRTPAQPADGDLRHLQYFSKASK
jgi:hypothetical protein